MAYPQGTACIRHALRGRGSRNLLVIVYNAHMKVTPCEGVGVEIGSKSDHFVLFRSRLARAWE